MSWIQLSVAAPRRLFCSVGCRVLAVAALALPLLLPAASGAMAGPPEYTLAAGDAVSFDFLDDELPPVDLTIGSDGNVSVPLLGSVRVAGLSVNDATDTLRREFIAREYLIDPKIALSVATYRPIFVIGDVASPGSYPFQPMLTVEQAVALAGGEATATATAEDRVVAGARLRGDLDEMAAELAREALAAARMTAQLAGRNEILDEDLPERARPVLDSNLVAALMPTEKRILDAEQRAYEARHNQLTAAIEEVRGALANLDKLVENQQLAIEAARSEVERMRGLSDRGLKTLSDLAGFERAAAAEDAQMLLVLNQMSSARRELGDLQRQLADATDMRSRNALLELQTHNAEIERLLAARRSVQEQVLLISGIQAQAARQGATISFSYEIRRRNGDAVGVLDADRDLDVLPGDTVVVAIETGETTPRIATAIPAPVVDEDL